MAAAPDQKSVRDEELLKRFVACRDAADGDGALHWWGKLVEANFDRVRGMVDLRAGRYALSADERQEAVQLALVKLWHNMVRTFRGSTMGEWVNSTKQLVEFACQQVQRDAAKRTERETAFDPAAVEPELGNPEERADASEFVEWALPQLDNERRRLVIERTLDGVPAPDIARELGVSMANLYALRSRGLKDLAKLRDRWYGT